MARNKMPLADSNQPAAAQLKSPQSFVANSYYFAEAFVTRSKIPG
jgi:hypothetical protein